MTILACMKVSDASAGWTPRVASSHGRCRTCGATVWISEASRKIAARDKAEIFCLEDALECRLAASASSASSPRAASA